MTGGSSLTRADIEAWSTEHLDTAAPHWSSTAQAWEEHFTTIHNGMLRPGGTTWEGAGADAAAERSWTDLVTVRGAADALHTAAGHATNGSGDVAWAKQQALNAIAEAEEDGFTVGQDLSVKDDSVPSLLDNGEDRQSKAKEHAHDIQAAVQQLVDTDKQTADRIHGALSPLNGLTFPEDGGKHDPTVKAVDYHPGSDPEDQPGAKPGDKPPAADPNGGLAGLMGVPDPTAKKPDPAPGPPGKPPANVLDLLAAQGQQGKPDAAAPGPGQQPGAPPTNVLDALAGKGGADPRYTKNPLTAPIVAADPSAVGQQAAKVDAARQAVDAAQAKLDAAAGQALTQGPGAGPGRDVTDPLSQSLMDARHNLTDQTKILQDLNATAVETGAPQAPVPALPEHADVQAFPAPPSMADQAARGLTDASHDISHATFGIVPDVAQDIHTFGHWDEASGTDRAGAVLDSASLIPGGKLLGEAGHGLDALAGAAHHADEIPTPHLDVPAPPHDVAPPVEHHMDAPIGHAPGEVPSDGGHGALDDMLLGHGGDAASMPHIDMNMKDGWSDFQHSQMQDKVDQFNNAVGDQGFSQVPPVPRDPGVRQDFLDSLGLDRVPPGSHVDHTRDLQAGGTDTIDNMGLLDGSVNSSFGSQLNKGMNQFPPGTVFGGVRLPDP